MRRPVFMCVVAAILSWSAGVPSLFAAASHDASKDMTSQAIETDSHVKELGRANAPFAHVMFCTKSPRECMRSQRTPTAIALDQEKMSELKAVNIKVNKNIRPRNDGGYDTWTLNPKTGDCEDFAITKRHLLLHKGWPTSVLRLAVGFTPSGEGHLVLIISTTANDLVLDNLTNEIRPYQEAGLSWNLIQSSQDPKIWHRMSR